jgi:hypothetical protein
MSVRPLRENREISGLAASAVRKRSASGRRGVQADDARAGEVRPLHTSEETGEQPWPTRDGVGRAKGGGRGKHGPAAHAPDPEPGKRAPEAGACTRSCLWASSLVTQGGSPVRELRPPGSVRGASRNGCPYRDRAHASPYAWIRDQALASKPSLGASLNSRKVAFRPSERRRHETEFYARQASILLGNNHVVQATIGHLR